MKLTKETLNKAFAEKNKQENRSKWFSQVIDVLAMINNIIAKIIPFPTFFTHQNYYKLKVINDGFSDLEDLWENGYKNQTSAHIKFVIDGMQALELSMTKEQLERFEQLNRFANIFPKAQNKEKNTPVDTGGNTLFPSSSSRKAPTEQPLAGTDTNSIEHIDLKPVYTLVPPWYLIPGLSDRKDEVDLNDLLNWFHETKKTNRVKVKYSSARAQTRIKKFNSLIEFAPQIKQAIDLFCDIMKKPKDGQGMLDEIIQYKLANIQQNSPALYEFFFEPFDKQREIFIAHPLIFKAFRIALDNEDNEIFIADLVTSLSFLDKLLPLSPPTTFTSGPDFISALALENDLNLLLGSMYGNYGDFNISSKKYIRDGGLNLKDLKDDASKIEKYLTKAYNEFIESKGTINHTYERITSFQHNIDTNIANTNSNVDNRFEELSDAGDDKENTPQFNVESTPPNAERNGLFDKNIELRRNPKAFTTPGGSSY